MKRMKVASMNFHSFVEVREVWNKRFPFWKVLKSDKERLGIVVNLIGINTKNKESRGRMTTTKTS